MLSHFDATAHDVDMYRGTKGTFELTAEVAAAEIYRARHFCDCEARVDARVYELDHSPQLPSQEAHRGCPSELHDRVDENFAFMNAHCFHSQLPSRRPSDSRWKTVTAAQQVSE